MKRLISSKFKIQRFEYVFPTAEINSMLFTSRFFVSRRKNYASKKICVVIKRNKQTIPRPAYQKKNVNKVIKEKKCYLV